MINKTSYNKHQIKYNDEESTGINNNKYCDFSSSNFSDRANTSAHAIDCFISSDVLMSELPIPICLCTLNSIGYLPLDAVT